MVGITRKVQQDQADLPDLAAGLAAEGTLESTANKGQPNGYAELDGAGKLPVAQLPAAILGSVTYVSTVDPTTYNFPAAASGNKGWYYVASIGGTTTDPDVSPPLTVNTGDWIISNGSIWEKVDANTDTEVIGPASATDNAMARFDGTTGKLVQNSVVTVSDVGDLAGVNSVKNSAITTPPTPASHGQTYFDDDYDCLMYYDSVKGVWLSVDSITVAFVRDATTGSGVVLNTFGGPAASTSPWYVETDPVMVTYVSAVTGAADSWLVGISDYSTGSIVSEVTYQITAASHAGFSTSKTFSAGQAILVRSATGIGSGSATRPVVTLTVKKYKTP